jgi:hypothetical protein
MNVTRRNPRKADIVHKLYKPWDSYDIEGSVTEAVGRWVDVDLG